MGTPRPRMISNGKLVVEVVRGDLLGLLPGLVAAVWVLWLAGTPTGAPWGLLDPCRVRDAFADLAGLGRDAFVVKPWSASPASLG
jgi:hypothetical protein